MLWSFLVRYKIVAGKLHTVLQMSIVILKLILLNSLNKKKIVFERPIVVRPVSLYNAI